MWIPILFAAGGYGLKRMRRRQRQRHVLVAPGPRGPLRGEACGLWAPPTHLAAEITSEGNGAVQQVAIGLGPLNLVARHQVHAFTAWMNMLGTGQTQHVSMAFAKHIAEQLSGGCRLHSFGRDLDVLRSIRDVGLVAAAAVSGDNPLQVRTVTV